jgi:hypothetical protein
MIFFCIGRSAVLLSRLVTRRIDSVGDTLIDLLNFRSFSSTLPIAAEGFSWHFMTGVSSYQEVYCHAPCAAMQEPCTTAVTLDCLQLLRYAPPGSGIYQFVKHSALTLSWSRHRDRKRSPFIGAFYY